MVERRWRTHGHGWSPWLRRSHPFKLRERDADPGCWPYLIMAATPQKSRPVRHRLGDVNLKGAANTDVARSSLKPNQMARRCCRLRRRIRPVSLLRNPRLNTPALAKAAEVEAAFLETLHSCCDDAESGIALAEGLAIQPLDAHLCVL